MSTLNVANIQSLSTSTLPVVKDSAGTEKGQFVRTWINFTGTGTVAINDHFNISSLVDNGVGHYTLNFTVAFSNTNYCYTDSGNGSSGGTRTVVTVTQNTNSFTFKTRGSCVAPFDPNTVCLAFFGD